MIIGVEYKSGRIKEFDPTVYTSALALSGGDRESQNAMTEFDLRLDAMEQDGLRLNVFWYDAARPHGEAVLEDTLDEKGKPAHIKRAFRRTGVTILIASRETLKSVSRIIVHRAGSTVKAVWRQGSGNWLVGGAAFDVARERTYTDAATTSLNAQAIAVFRYLRRANPDASPEKLCEMMGYPIDLYHEIEREESLQLDESRAIEPRDVEDDERSRQPIDEERDIGQARPDGKSAEDDGGAYLALLCEEGNDGDRR